MASALEKLMKGTIKKPESVKAFIPWWEDLQDKLLYSLMIFGMITLPFNMVSNTPVECTLDQNDESFQNLSVVEQQPMRYHHFYLRKYCTMNYIHDTMVFLPFLLILCPLPLVGVGQMCLRYFRVQKRMNAFYTLLVKDSLDREDVEAMEKEKVKNSYEVWQMFRDSNGIYYSYIAKSLILLIFGTGIAALMIWILIWGVTGEEIGCTVFERRYVCVVPLANFYFDIVVASTISIMGFLICNIYTLAWILFPRLSPFHRLMQLSYKHVDDQVAIEKKGDIPRNFTLCLPVIEDAEPFFDVYFDSKSRDLGLLITLLAACNGLAEGLRLVAIFDKDYQKLWRPLEMKVYHDETTEGVVHVEWGDAPIAAYIHNFHGRTGDMRVEYTLEMSPPSKAEAPLKSHDYRPSPHPNRPKFPHLDSSMKEIKNSYKYRDTFHGVEVDRPTQRPGSHATLRPKLMHQPISIRTLSGSEYFTGNKEDSNSSKKKELPKVIISTEVNGRTIAQRTEKVPVPPVVVITSPPPLIGDTKFFQEDDEYELEEDSECARLLNASDSACKSRRKQSVPGEAVEKVIKDQNRDVLLGGGGGGEDLLL